MCTRPRKHPPLGLFFKEYTPTTGDSPHTLVCSVVMGCPQLMSYKHVSVSVLMVVGDRGVSIDRHGRRSSDGCVRRVSRVVLEQNVLVAAEPDVGRPEAQQHARITVLPGSLRPYRRLSACRCAVLRSPAVGTV